MKTIVLDLDEILHLIHVRHDTELRRLAASLDKYRSNGFRIILSSSVSSIKSHRNPNEKTIASFEARLASHSLNFDEINLGKPHAHPESLTIDDKAITRDEFLTLPYEEIVELLKQEAEEEKQ